MFEPTSFYPTSKITNFCLFWLSDLIFKLFTRQPTTLFNLLTIKIYIGVSAKL